MAINIESLDCPSDTHKSYRVSFFDDTIYTLVTNDPATVTEWISDIESFHHHRRHRLIVGLDVEWRPNFSRHQNNRVATLQLCVGRRCLIYQIIHSTGGHIPGSLVEFLCNENYTFVGVNIAEDLNKLERDYGFGGGNDTNAVDLRRLAANEYDRPDLKNAGLKMLARVLLEKEVSKPKSVTMSRWDNRKLTPAQVQYASVDAYLCFEIGRKLNASD
ncbi:hypothetical protein CASFOL_025587 [Castilleja foliolosa]|uniref:3'-5' exonuclease domain-containing protein n=1 Tax=Castilleja foliolosa TaxID=1961234 RepID=A0ABD3CRJ6_9LAMI